MTRQEQIERIIQNCLDGLETMEEARVRLGAMKVRGGFDGLAYTGFDYQDQRWVEHGRPLRLSDH